ncbi:MBL fold metallo-hydrolase [Chitinophaga sancti]|uniref:MBL fold metallo-hydrolase n=1 Tax=Chitinophaga sancti TaxID=1004 RepID=UPI003F7A1C2D
MKTKMLMLVLVVMSITNITAQQLPKANVVLAVNTRDIKIFTLVAPPEMFSNTTHVIELPNELIVVDGQFFAPYAQQVKALTDSLKKPITRFYISHDHPDHYLGFGDAFPDAPVYALRETKEKIEKEGKSTLEQRQKQFGIIIANSLNIPTHIQEPGEQTIEGVKFIFEKSLHNEDEVSLVIKVPAVNVYIAQDIVYNKTHLFISGDTGGWKKALKKIESEKHYSIILPGHGNPGNRSIIAEDLKYLDFVDKTLANTTTKDEYKAKLLAAYPQYGGIHLIDIYLAYYLKKDWINK